MGRGVDAVIARAAVDGIARVGTFIVEIDQRVVAGAADHRILAGATGQRIVAKRARGIERIAARAAV